MKATGEINNVFPLPMSINSEHAVSCPLHVKLIITWMTTLAPSGILPPQISPSPSSSPRPRLLANMDFITYNHHLTFNYISIIKLLLFAHQTLLTGVTFGHDNNAKDGTKHNIQDNLTILRMSTVLTNFDI